MPEILRFRSVANPGPGQPVGLKLSRFMALLVASGTICWTGASWSQVPAMRPVVAAPLSPTELGLHQFVHAHQFFQAIAQLQLDGLHSGQHLVTRGHVMA